MKLNKIIQSLLAISLLGTGSTYAASFQYSAGVANSLGGVGGASLASTDVVEIGTYSGGAFTSLDSGSVDNVGFGAGFFSHDSGAQNTNSIAGSQLAFRWTQASTGQVGIAYYDISTGSDAALVAQWTVKAGDGGGTDFASNAVDISTLTVDNGSYNTLDSAATLINVEFSGSNAAGVPSFNVVPEPSTYAMLAGALALGYVMVRRRKA